MLIQGPGELFVDEIEHFWGHQWIPHQKRVQISHVNFYFELFLDPFTNPPTPTPFLLSALPPKSWALLQAPPRPGPPESVWTVRPWWRPCMLVLNGLIMLIELLWAYPRTLLSYIISWKTVLVWSLLKCRYMAIFTYLTIFFTVVKRIQSQDCHEGWKNYCYNPTQVLKIKGYWLRKNTC